MQNFRNALTFACALLLLGSCSENRKVKKEVQKIALETIGIKRYEQALFKIDTLKLQQELQQLQPDFFPFLDADLSIPENIGQIHAFVSDTSVKQIYETTMREYPDLTFLEKDLTLAFKHIKYHFPDWEPPAVYSYVSGLYFEAPVKYSGSELIIAIDMYLGEAFEMYRKIGMPLYQVARMNRNYILADCIEEIIRAEFVSGVLPNNMLDKMIAEGKVLYFMDLFLPWLADEYKIGYTNENIRWCQKNESNMWAYFIENELLFSSDPLIVNRFVNDGPFTAAFHRESPARAALWVGWQIVKSYMNNNRGLTPGQLNDIQESREILNASGYKPGRFGF